MSKPKIAGGVELLDEKARKLLEDDCHSDEAVQFCLLGQRMRDTSPTGDVLVVLNERVLVVRHGMNARNNPIFGGGTEAVSLYYVDINGLDLRKRFLTGSIHVDRPGLPLPPEIIVDKARLDEYRPYIDEINKKVHDAEL
jgi:hypothetical protein